MTAIDEKKERIKKAVLHLISKEIISAKSPQKDIATKLGAKNSTNINYALNGNEKYLTDSFMKRFNNVFNSIFDENWLLTGEGEMLNNSTSSAFQPNARPIDNLNYMNVPVIHIKAHCGYLNGYGDEGYIDTLPTMPVIVDKTYHGKYRIFEASGDSMDDGTRNSICDGDKLLCREVRRDLWLPKLHIKDWYFVIVHRTEGISIKQITEQDEMGNITCHPLNNLFNDYTLNLNDVAEIYNVIQVVERSLRL